MSMQCSMTAGVTYKSNYVKVPCPIQTAARLLQTDAPRPEITSPLLAFGGRNPPWGLLVAGI